MKPQSNLKEASIRTRRVARARLQLVRKFREQLNHRDTECAGGRVVRRAQCDHRPHEAPISIAEIRGLGTQQCRQHVPKRCQTRCDCFPLSTRSRPHPASTDSSGFRHFQPFELLAIKRSPILKGTRATVALSRNRTRVGGRWRPTALRSCAFVASRCAPVRSFAGRHDHKQFKAWPGLPRESVSGNPCQIAGYIDVEQLLAETPQRFSIFLSRADYDASGWNAGRRQTANAESPKKWCCQTGLNCRPLHYQWSALPLSYGSVLRIPDSAKKAATRRPILATRPPRAQAWDRSRTSSKR